MTSSLLYDAITRTLYKAALAQAGPVAEATSAAARCWEPVSAEGSEAAVPQRPRPCDHWWIAHPEEGGRDPHGYPGSQEMPRELQEHPMELTREKRCVAQLQELVESLKELELKMKEATADELKHIAQLEEQLREEEEQRKVLRQELRHLQEDIEDKEIEHAWQQQMELQAVAQGCVMSEVLEARLKTEELARRRGAFSWLWTFCLIFLCVELAVTFMLGVAVLYASYYDREFFHLLLHVLPEDIFTDLAHFLEETPSLVSEGVPPH